MGDNNKGPEIPKFMYDEYARREEEEKRSKAQQRELYLANKRMLEEMKKVKIAKRETIQKRVRNVVLAGALVALGGISIISYQQFIGSERIADKFNQYTDGYCIYEQNNGYIAMVDGRQISLDSVFHDIVNDARYDGMSDVEIHIGISKLYDPEVARIYVGSVSFEDKFVAKLNAYGEGIAKKFGVEWNDNRTGGGMTK